MRMNPFHEETQRARGAQNQWCQTPVRQRLRVIAEFRYRLVESRDAITSAIEQDIARDPAEVLGTDVLPTASACKFLVQNAVRILRPKRVSSRPFWLMGSRDAVHRRAWGIVGIIGTWNYPLFLNAVPALQALAAGNAVLWKPSEQTPKFAELFTKLIHDSGIPNDLFQQLPATRETGPMLAEADADFIHFTGSDFVGRKLASRLGERLIPSTLELSGVDALIVLPDANVKLAARAAWYAMNMNRGQTCMSSRRIFLHDKVREEFLNELRPFVDASLAVQLQMPSQIEQMRELLDEAQSQGCTIWTGQAGSTETISPAVILTNELRLRICNEATFSPVAAIIPFQDASALATMHNASPFGLSSAIFGNDRSQMERIAAEMRSGSVVFNDVVAPTAHPATPFGGRGASGWNVSQGEEGLLAMSVPQVVTYRKGTFRPHIDAGLKPDAAAADVMTGMLRGTHSRSFWERLRGFVQMIRGMISSGKN